MQEKELKQFRTLNSKHIIQKDKTIKVQLYNENIHYLENGEYKEIDNSITNAKDKLINKSNNFKVAFNKKDGSIDIAKNDKTLNMSLENSNMEMYEFEETEGIKIVDKIKFNNVFSNIDIVYEIHPNKLKEKIILNKKPKINEIKFKFKTDLNLKLNNNKIVAKDKNKTIYLIDKPFMVDENNKFSENIEYILDKNSDNYELTIKLDKDWLDSKERKYPVIIDPTVSHIEDSTNVINTYIYDGDSNVTTYNRGYLLVGKDDKYIYRTLLKFFLPEIPSSYKLVNADLNLFNLPDSTTQVDYDSIFTVNRITKEWTETAKWSNMCNAYSSEIEDYFILGDVAIPSYSSYANVTKLVKDWYNNPGNNYGLMLKLYNEEDSANVIARFASNDSSYMGSNPKPVVVITYKNYNGVESYLSYSSQGHFFGNSYVSNYTGNLNNNI